MAKNIKEIEKCIMCGDDGEQLQEISKLKIKAFGKIPLNDIVKIWYNLGFKETDVVCEECILK